MPVYKDEKTNTWRVIYRYKNALGQRTQGQKRGFETRREAVAWEHEQMSKHEIKLDMTFESFFEIYANDMKNRVRENTWKTKESIYEKKILPFFKDKRMNEIQVKDIIAWQNAMMDFTDEKGRHYSPVYLKTLHNQLSAVFNHAVKYYELPSNPAAKAGAMGKRKGKEMLFWTQDEYKLFAEQIMDKPMSYYAFEMLYWCGLREGELLALTQADFDFTKKTVSINKSYQRINGRDVITDPKTPKSNRIIKLPDFLAEEMQDYISHIYGVQPYDRLFPITKSYLHNEMTRGSAAANVKRIRIHDLRHSHISLLIDMGYSAVAIGERVGPESAEITYQYAHLFPSVQSEMANDLNNIKMGDDEDVSEES